MNDKVKPDEQPDERLDLFGQRAGKLLREAPLEADVRDALHQARATALSAPRSASRSPLVARYVRPIALAAGVAACALWVAWPLMVPDAHNDPLIEAMSVPLDVENEDLELAVVDFELIATAEDFALLEDLEFLQWLAVAEDAS